jgi:hypothetical protein
MGFEAFRADVLVDGAGDYDMPPSCLLRLRLW